ncbi:MAG: aspartate aminotransferase family protein [Paracoccaceae bacterium]
MSALFHRTCNAALPTAETGDGCYITDSKGKMYLDACGGAAVSCLGHSDETVKRAMRAQLDKLPFAHTGFFTSAAAESFADLLTAHAPKGLNRVYPVSGGSEAVEAAIKLARQYFIEIGQPCRHRVIARRQSYHGNTLGALAAGGNMWRRAPFDALMIETSHIAPCYEYRDRQADETPFDYGQRVANELAAELERLGPESVMAFIAEPVVGATAGAVPAVEGYFKRVREICDRYGVLLILDEVMCGMGRTGTLFACEQDGVTPDIVTVAKGLGAGYQPVGAMLCSNGIHDAIADGSGFFQHGHTYIGHPMAMAAAGAVLTRLTDGRTLPRVAAAGETLQARLDDRLGQHPHVGDIRGKGLFRGIELVQDRETKTPFAPVRQLHKRIKENAMEAGLMCYPMGGTIDGKSGHHVLLAPPFIIENPQIDELVDKLAHAIDTAIAA